jgi:hypothetical protein
LKGLAAVPLPTSLASFFGGGGAAVGTGLAVKAAAVVVAGAVVGAAGYEGVKRKPWVEHSRPATPQRSSPTVNPLSQQPLAPIVASHAVARQQPAQRPKHAGKHGRKHGRGETVYAGDASVAARHVKAVHVPQGRAVGHTHVHAARPVHPSHPAQKPPRAPKTRPFPANPRHLPGPFDASPPGHGPKKDK